MHQVGFNYFDDNIISKNRKNQYNSNSFSSFFNVSFE
jgi:hypothetical protein